MDVRSDRRYRFASPPDVLWAAMTQVDAYQRWWPWLRAFDGTTFAEGATWRCVVQPPLPYTLRFSIRLEEVGGPRFVTASIDGDITGHAAIDVTPIDGGCELRLISTLSPRNAALRAVARVAQPLVRFGHDWVLDAGLRQFERRGLG